MTVCGFGRVVVVLVGSRHGVLPQLTRIRHPAPVVHRSVLRRGAACQRWATRDFVPWGNP